MAVLGGKAMVATGFGPGIAAACAVINAIDAALAVTSTNDAPVASWWPETATVSTN
jgi:hypothetical protein